MPDEGFVTLIPLRVKYSAGASSDESTVEIPVGAFLAGFVIVTRLLATSIVTL